MTLDGRTRAETQRTFDLLKVIAILDRNRPNVKEARKGQVISVQ